jgi:hypothetical protein
VKVMWSNFNVPFHIIVITFGRTANCGLCIKSGDWVSPFVV